MTAMVLLQKNIALSTKRPLFLLKKDRKNIKTSYTCILPRYLYTALYRVFELCLHGFHVAFGVNHVDGLLFPPQHSEYKLEILAFCFYPLRNQFWYVIRATTSPSTTIQSRCESFVSRNEVNRRKYRRYLGAAVSIVRALNLSAYARGRNRTSCVKISSCSTLLGNPSSNTTESSSTSVSVAACINCVMSDAGAGIDALKHRVSKSACGEFALVCSSRRSWPVEMCFVATRDCAARAHWVPLPTPGPPLVLC